MFCHNYFNLLQTHAHVNFIAVCILWLSIHSIGLQDGFNGLYMASQNGHTSSVDVLLKNGANPNFAVTVSKE